MNMNHGFDLRLDTTQITIKGNFGSDAKKIIFTDADKKTFATYVGSDKSEVAALL